MVTPTTILQTFCRLVTDQVTTDSREMKESLIPMSVKQIALRTPLSLTVVQ